MGLDNGFLVKSDRRQLTRAMLPDQMMYPFDEDYNDDIEIVYHRKDWGWRNDIMQHFGWGENKYTHTIDTPAQVLELIELTAHWLDEGRWEEEGRSIWDYDQARPHLIEDIINFACIYGFMKDNPDVYLEFYDSY